MATISVRVEDDLKDLAEETAAAQGLSVSEWTREVMRTQLGMDRSERSAPVSLSMRERRQLVLLHRVLEQTSGDEDDAAYHSTRIEVLENGFTAEYSDEYYTLSDELPMNDCRLVWNLLDMFTVLERSADKVGIDALRLLDVHAERIVRFGGFDFNDSREGHLASYAKFLIQTGRWTNLAVYFDDKHERGNSHMPMLRTYLRMLDVFQPLWKQLLNDPGYGRYELNEEELHAVIKAWPYPK